jgi:hypothetical protein
MAEFIIRDFIYMDAEKLKSIVAQIDEGLVDQQKESQANSKETSVGAKIGIAIGLDAGKKFMQETQNSQTKSLHDYIYNKVEDALIENEILMELPISMMGEEEAIKSEISRDEVLKKINESSFVLITGKVVMNYYPLLYEMVDKVIDSVKKLSDTEAKKGKEHSRENGVLQVQQIKDEKKVKAVLSVLKLFYGDRIILKIVPEYCSEHVRFVGILRTDCLRYDLSDISYKFGTAPDTNWNVLAQICTITKKGQSISRIRTTASNEIEKAIEPAFQAIREAEQLMGLSVNYPEISITPIAIYRT